jgi:Ca2+/Na+ antiporter
MIMAFVLGISAVFFYVIRKDWRVTRKEGLLLLLLYITAQIALIYFTQYTI